TGFRFDAASVANSPALRRLQDGLECLDAGVQTLDRLVTGEEPDPSLLHSNAGFAPQVRQLGDVIAALSDERDEEAAARVLLERKMQAVLNAIDAYRATVTAMAELAEEGRNGMVEAQDSLHR